MYGAIKTFIIILICVFLAGCAGRQLKCNLHVIDEARKKGIYLPDTTANSLDKYLKSSPDWHTLPKTKKKKLDHAAAYKAAKSGKTVIASYNGGAKNGHIVMLNGKKKPVWSQSFGANVPYASGSVKGRDAKITPLSYQFSADKEPRMNYFIYTGKK